MSALQNVPPFPPSPFFRFPLFTICLQRGHCSAIRPQFIVLVDTLMTQIGTGITVILDVEWRHYVRPTLNFMCSATANAPFGRQSHLTLNLFLKILVPFDHS